MDSTLLCSLVTCYLPVSCADNLGRPRLLGVGFHTGADFINGSLVDVSTAMVSNSVSFQCISVAPSYSSGLQDTQLLHCHSRTPCQHHQ